jgi:hypothetical protein
MKVDELTEGMEVIDRWYPEWGVGVVTKLLKTVVYIDFTVRGPEKYDMSHVRNFLEKEADHFMLPGDPDASASLL